MAPRRRARFHVALLALAGAGALGAGLFGPAVYVGAWAYRGELRYWDLAGPERYGVLAAAAVALPGVYRRRHSLIVLASLGLWSAIAYPWVKSWITPERDGLLARVGNAIARPIEEMTTRLVLDYGMLHVRWGAWSLLGGALGLTLAGVLVLRGGRA